MKTAGYLLALLVLASCGGGGKGSDGSSASSTPNQTTTTAQCAVVMSTISLKNGETCNLSAADAALFAVSPGVISCSAGTITYNGNTFQSGTNGFTFNNLKLACAK